VRFTKLRLSELTRRLGAQTAGAEPGVMFDQLYGCVQIADLHELVPPLLSPRCHVGGGPAVTAGSFSAFQIRCRSNGGVWVDRLQVSALAASLVRYEIAATPRTLTTTFSMLNQNFGPTPCASVVEQGDVLGLLLGTTNPNVVVAGGGAPSIINPFYLPPGFSFFLESIVANVVLATAANLQEFVTARAEEP